MTIFESDEIRVAKLYIDETEYREKRNWSKQDFDDYLRTIDKYVKSKNINKEMLRELKKYFNLSTDFWYFLENVNCYAYGVGCDLPPRCINKHNNSQYYPGCFYEAINQTKLEQTKDNLSARMEMDFETLEYDYRIVSPDEEVSEDEWKIAFFNDILIIPYNFHFLRQGKDGTWYHKMGNTERCIPTNRDDKGTIITDPREARFVVSGIYTEQKIYEFNKCYSLKMR